MTEEYKALWTTYDLMIRDLQQAKKKGIESHLLLGNGFNDSIGISTSYSTIFEKMMKINSAYKKVENDVKRVKYDIEEFLRLLKESISNTNLPNDGQKYLVSHSAESRVKSDFMMALFKLVNKTQMPEIKKRKISGFLRNFSNYFTLNYDPFLYLLLLKLDPPAKYDDITSENKLLEMIKQLHKFGIWTTEIPNVDKNDVRLIDLKRKPDFLNNCINYLVPKGHDKEKIKDAVDSYWEEQQRQKKAENVRQTSIPFDDGFERERGKAKTKEDSRYVYRGTSRPATDDLRQNLYYLHGALHIMQEDNSTIRIPIKSEKQVGDCFINAADMENENYKSIYVLSGETDDKKSQIEGNDYLRDCLNALGEIKGHVVILGSSLDNNDKHIFDRLMRDDVQKLYISTTKGDDLIINRAKSLFKGKYYEFFDYQEIPYTPRSKS